MNSHWYKMINQVHMLCKKSSTIVLYNHRYDISYDKNTNDTVLLEIIFLLIKCRKKSGNSLYT